MEQVGHEFVAPGEDSQVPVVGEAGVEVWRFKAFTSGATLISWEYYQPWDGGDKRAWSFALEVTVK